MTRDELRKEAFKLAWENRRKPWARRWLRLHFPWRFI